MRIKTLAADTDTDSDSESKPNPFRWLCAGSIIGENYLIIIKCSFLRAEPGQPSPLRMQVLQRTLAGTQLDSEWPGLPWDGMGSDGLDELTLLQSFVFTASICLSSLAQTSAAMAINFSCDFFGTRSACAAVPLP